MVNQLCPACSSDKVKFKRENERGNILRSRDETFTMGAARASTQRLIFYESLQAIHIYIYQYIICRPGDGQTFLRTDLQRYISTPEKDKRSDIPRGVRNWLIPFIVWFMNTNVFHSIPFRSEERARFAHVGARPTSGRSKCKRMPCEIWIFNLALGGSQYSK